MLSKVFAYYKKRIQIKKSLKRKLISQIKNSSTSSLTNKLEQCWIQNHSNTRPNPHLQYIPGRSHYKHFCKKCCDWLTLSWSGSDMFSRLPTYWPCRWSFWPWISFCRPLWIARRLGRLWRAVCNRGHSAASERGRQWWPHSKLIWRRQKGWTKK